MAEPLKLEGHSDRVWSVSWSPCGNFLASTSGDKSVRVWEREGSGWRCQNVLDEGHTKTIRTADWSPDGRFLATSSFDRTTGIWERFEDEFEFTASLEGHENEVKCARWHPSGKLLSTCGRDKTVWIWDALSTSEFDCVSVLSGHSQDVKAVVWHPTKDILVSASYDNSIKVWAEDEDHDDWHCQQTLGGTISGHTSTVWEVAFNSDGSQMVSCSDDLTLKIWNTVNEPQEASSSGQAGWTLASTLSGYHDRTIFSVDWSNVNGLIATGSGDNSISIFTLDDPQSTEPEAKANKTVSLSLVTKIPDAHSADINCVRWHPKDPKLLATAGDDGLVKIWSIEIPET